MFETNSFLSSAMMEEKLNAIIQKIFSYIHWLEKDRTPKHAPNPMEVSSRNGWERRHGPFN